MMSRNNVGEISKRAFNQSQRYALRKLSVGVASVLIGTTAYVGLAHADTVAVNNESASIERVPASATTLLSSNDRVTSSARDSRGSVQAASSSNISNKVTSNTDAQQVSSPAVNRLDINSTNQQTENSLQASLVQASNNPDWTRNGYYQARASNVDFQLTDSYGQAGNGTGAELPTEISLGFNENYHFGIKAHFTIQTSDLKLNNRVYIGSIRLSNSLNDPAHNIAIFPSPDPRELGEFSYQGQYIGRIYECQLDDSNADFFLKVEQANVFTTPVIDVADWSNKDIYGYNWSSAAKYFVNVPKQFTENLTMPGGKTYHFNMFYDYHELSESGLHVLTTISTHDFNLYDYTYPVFAKNIPGQRLNASDFAILNDKNGQGLVLPNTGYEMAYSYRPSVNTVHPTSFQVFWDVDVKDKNNKLTNEVLLVNGPSIQYTNAGNGYSLNELKQMCSGNAGVYSLQNDGTYLCYLNLLPSALVMNRDSLIYSLKSRSKIVAMQGNQALMNTLNFYYDQPLGGRSFEMLLYTPMTSTSRYDSLLVDNVQLIDPSTSNVLARYDWRNVPDTLQLSGKAAIRVHYINGYNGQQIGNSQIFNDDQGKTLSYQAQNSLGNGYSFRRLGSHALLDGQSLPASYTLLDGSQKSAITYPKENTVSDVYYVIDPDPQQLVINYYDLAGKLVVSQQVAGYTDQRVPLSYSVPAGYVLLTQSQPTSYQFGPDHNVLDLIVAPRVTMVMDSRTVTRTVTVQSPAGQTRNVVQTVTFTRNSYFNQVTKQTTYSPWSFGGHYQFSGYQPKPIDWYTVDVAQAVIVTPDSSDTMLGLAYHKIPITYTVHYQLVNGKAVANVSVTPNGDGRIQLIAPVGYRLLTNVNTLQAGFGSQKFVVLVVSDEQTYRAHDSLPSGVKEPLTKMITRTVKITMPNGHVRMVKQSVKFERTAIVNADGTVSYSNWQAIGRAQFNQVFVARRHGYHLVITDASGKSLSDVAKVDHVTEAMSDTVVSVKYVKD